MCHFLENGKCRILTVNACSDCCKFAKTTEQFEAAETAAKNRLESKRLKAVETLKNGKKWSVKKKEWWDK